MSFKLKHLLLFFIKTSLRIKSYNFGNTNHLIFYTLDRERFGTAIAHKVYEFQIIQSPHPIHILTYHKPLLQCLTKKCDLSPRF